METTTVCPYCGFHPEGWTVSFTCPNCMIEIDVDEVSE